MPSYGKRNDGTSKNIGYFGELLTGDGSRATEYAIGVELGGKETEIPTLVPTLTKSELNKMLYEVIPRGSEIPKDIVDKAIKHAKSRLRRGLSPFVESSVESTSAKLGIQ